MKKYALVALMVLAVAGFAIAQNTYSPPSDVLGAHLNYGRGCAGCHAPHSGAWGNGANKSKDGTAGNVILWGQDVGNLFSKVITTGSTNGSTGYVETLPGSMSAGTPDVLDLITCLSCHDGNWAQGAMMKNAVYETLPSTYGTYNTIPTLLGNDGNGLGDYLNDHPVGQNASVSCTGQYNWDCTEVNGKIYMNGTNSAKFVADYGNFVSLSAWNNNATVMCTSCHNQHLMNVVAVTTSNSGQPTGYYQTMFFIRGPYNPSSTTPGANTTAQFCRNCHGGEANESNNGSAGTTY